MLPGYKKRNSFYFFYQPRYKKIQKKIITLATLIWSGSLLHNIAAVFAPIVIAAVMPDGLAYAGVFTLGQYMTSLMQAPQRGIIAASWRICQKHGRIKITKR